MKSKRTMSLIIHNLIKDKLSLIHELNKKDNIINNLKNKINSYERRLTCQK